MARTNIHRPKALALVAAGAILAAILWVALATTEPAQAAFPGNNGRILFLSNRGGTTTDEIYTMSKSGARVVRLTNNNMHEYEPAWSPSGRKIAFSAADGRIRTMNADGTGITPITNPSTGIRDTDPAWSTNGSKIVFSRFVSGAGNEIFTMNADGTNPVRLTTNTVDDREPDWTGTKLGRIVWQQNGNIWSMKGNGLNKIQLTTAAGSESNPDWSPDKTKIAYEKDSGNSIYTMNADGTRQLPLTIADTVRERNPAWSPDGTKIVFHGSTSFTAPQEIYSFSYSEGGVVFPANLTESPSADDEDPDWQPIPQ
jgi:TolB protein